MTQEKLQATIPAANKWHNEDIEVKAKKLGMEKSEFILKSIDMMMNFDEEFYKKIQKYSEGLNAPEYIVIQNMIIKNMASDAAKVETNTWVGKDKIMSEFQVVNDKGIIKMVTGEELFNSLKEEFIFEIKHNK